MFYLTIASMQLVEFLLWRYGFTAGKAWNRVLSAVALSLILLQPLAAGLLIQNQAARWAYWACYAAWLALYLWLHSPIRLETTVAPNKHLAWLWLRPGAAFIVTWTLFIVAAVCMSDVPPLNAAMIVGWIVLLTAWSYAMYRNYDGAWGSVYCSFMNAIFLVVLAKAFLKQYRQCPLTR